MKHMGKKFLYIIGATAIISLALTIVIFGYNKKVEANKLKIKFDEFISSNQFTESLYLYNCANEDYIIKNIFNFNKAAKELVNDAYSSLQNDYLNFKISYKEYQEKASELDKFNFLDKKIASELASQVAKIEAIRDQYNGCVAIYEKKDYAAALIALGKLSTEDEKTKYKINVLITNVTKDFKDQVTQQLESKIKDEKYNEGIELLNSNKTLFSDEEINNKISDIKQLIKLKEEEEAKKKALEEKRQQENLKKEQAIIANYLIGYVPCPDKENSVSNIQSASKFLLTVELKEQSTNIFIGKIGEWKLIKKIACSTGAAGYDTPKGSFQIGSRGEWFFSNKYKEGAEYWTSFFGDFLFHSLPMNSNRIVIDETLGTPASHGCVRLKIQDAKWIYDNINSGSKVIIR